MKTSIALAIIVIAFASTSCSNKCIAVAAKDPMNSMATDDDDPYLWLEEIQGEDALEWAKERSAETTATLEAVPQFPDVHRRLLDIYNSADALPYPGLRGDYIYNFWQDAEHVRGIWRRTTPEDYESESPDWEIVLDVDALASSEGENWVWKGPDCLPPDYRFCLLKLSRGGSDAAVFREFDTATAPGTFVEDGFFVQEAKTFVSWKHKDSLFVATDFGEDSMTASGYPRLVKEWTRGSSIDDAVTIYEGEFDDVRILGISDFTPERRYDLVRRVPTFFTEISYLNTGQELIQLDIPEDARLKGFFRDYMLIHLRSDWAVGGAETFPSDALLVINFDEFLDGGRNFHVLFEPSERVAFDGMGTTADYVVYSTLDNINGRLYRAAPSSDSDGWTREEIDLPGLGSVGIVSTSDTQNRFFFSYTDFVTPTSLYLADDDDEPRQVKATPEWYDSSGVTVVQNQAASKDGTMIPYFMVMPRGFEANGGAANPTLLYGYGGFEISMRPQYLGTFGASWIERGGVFVLANIRGGGEFGPKWHQAAVREKHQTNFDDFVAIAEDLINLNITSPDRLGIMGGSQGGLLVGGSFVQRPELFGAVVCVVPLLDMKRYNKLLAGASWQDEYGNPDTEDWDNYMKFWSPYHNLDPEEDYPRVLFTTSTNDDRVHPGHARKMAAKMIAMNKPVYYYENFEGGHSGAANNNERAYNWALEFSYLWKTLNATDPIPEFAEAPTTASAADERRMFPSIAAIIGIVLFMKW